MSVKNVLHEILPPLKPPLAKFAFIPKIKNIVKYRPKIVLFVEILPIHII